MRISDWSSDVCSSDLAAEALRSLIDTMGEGVISINAEGVVTAVSPACAAIFGYGAAELTGQNIKILMPEPFRSGHDSYVRLYISPGHAKIPGLGRDTLGHKKNGEIIPINLSAGEIGNGRELGFTAD